MAFKSTSITDDLKHLIKDVEKTENSENFIWDDYLSACHKFYEQVKYLVTYYDSE